MLICDLAETYKIYDYKALPISLVATLAAGLRKDSRVKMEMSKQKLTYTEQMLALIFDALQFIHYKQGHKKGQQRPKSLFESLMKKEEKEELMSFDTIEDFERWRNSKIKG